MTSTQFSLLWDSYQKNICSGLSSLQQNGEFVDMTLAADGHHVKVHQFMISLLSPYLKEIIKSIDCKHPVIFLNKISYKTLCYILEYVYTGQANVAQEDIKSLIEAGKALKIKGLEDMSVRHSINTSQTLPSATINQDTETVEELSSLDQDNLLVEQLDMEVSINEQSNDSDSMHIEDTNTSITDSEHITEKKKSPKSKENPTLQYTVSNQGSLQMILNRFMYYLRYHRKKDNTGHRLWRCVDYVRGKCPASVVTKNNVVVQRVSAHIHPFHDKKIMKKVQSGGVFTAIPDAEREGEIIKKNKMAANVEVTEIDQQSASA
ncbi:uncharacterized protein ACR2FA_007506 [Aphomia sociella]